MESLPNKPEQTIAEIVIKGINAFFAEKSATELFPGHEALRIDDSPTIDDQGVVFFSAKSE